MDTLVRSNQHRDNQHRIDSQSPSLHPMALSTLYQHSPRSISDVSKTHYHCNPGIYNQISLFYLWNNYIRTNSSLTSQTIISCKALTFPTIPHRLSQQIYPIFIHPVLRLHSPLFEHSTQGWASLAPTTIELTQAKFLHSISLQKHIA